MTYFGAVSVVATSNVTQTLVNGNVVFQSAGSDTPMPFDQDWAWPTITMTSDLSAGMTTGAYVVVAYEVDASVRQPPISDAGAWRMGPPMGIRPTATIWP